MSRVRENILLLAALIAAFGLCSCALNEAKSEIDFLVQKAESKDALVRAPALGSLLETEGEYAEQKIRELLQSQGSPQTRASLIRLIARKGDRRFDEELILALADSDPDVRAAAEEALLAFIDGQLKRRLSDVAAGGGNPAPVRAGAVSVLSHIGSKEEAGLFIRLLSTEDPALKEALFEGLSRITHADVEPSEGQWRKWWQKHADMDESAWIEQAVSKLEQENKKLRLRIEELEKSSQSALAEVRAEAARAIIDQLERRIEGDDPAPLIEALDSKFEQVVVYSLKRLAGMPSASLPESLSEKLINMLQSPAWQIRAEAANALGGFANVRTGRALERLLGDGVPNVRMNAARSIGRVGYGPAVVPLRGLLTDVSPDVRMAAVCALGELKAEATAASIISLLSDVNPDVRWEAAKALGSIKAPSAVQPLIQVLDDASPRVRWYACDSLGKIGDLKAVEPLLKKLSDEDAGVRESALDSLAALNDLRALEGMETLISDREKRVARKAWSAYVQMASGKKEILKAACEKYLGLKEYEKALELFDSYLKIYGNDSAEDGIYAQVNMARIHLAVNREKEALDIFAELVSEYPDNVEVRAEYAGELFARKLFEEAAGHLPELIKLDPGKKDEYFKKALTILEDFSSQNKHKEVVGFCVRLEAADGSLGGDEMKAKILELKKKSEEALSPPAEPVPELTPKPQESKKEEGAPEKK